MHHPTVTAATRYALSPRAARYPSPQAALAGRLRARRIIRRVGSARGRSAPFVAAILAEVRLLEEERTADAIRRLSAGRPAPAEAEIVPFAEHALARDYQHGARLRMLCDECRRPQTCTDADECRTGAINA